ncbi:MAG: hypothetical protein AAF384_15580, partial [Pseudomonadota bacterium]
MKHLFGLGLILTFPLIPLPSFAIALPSPLIIKEVGGIAPELIRAVKEQPPGAKGRLKIEIDRLEVEGWLIEDIEFELK